MAKVYPFRALRYASRIPTEKVVTQPYDKISPEMQNRYYELHPDNLIRIVLGKSEPEDSPDNNVYTRAAASLRRWRERGVVEQIETPAFFVYFQKFTVPGTRDVRLRKGFVGLAQLEDYANRVVFPHEKTLTGPKRDRLELLRHTRTHFEQIFMLYEDPGRQIDRLLDDVAVSRPDIEVEDEYGVVHSLWTVSDPERIAFIQSQMADRKLIIADGHHRYETALAYRDERRSASATADSNAAYERLCMTFFNMDSPGLTILPTHRVLSRIENFDLESFLRRAGEFFNAGPAPDHSEGMREELQTVGASQTAIGVFAQGGQSAILTVKPSLDMAAVLPDLSAKQRQLDVALLHRLLIEKGLGISEEAVRRESHISYLRDMEGAFQMVREGKAQIAFLLNPTGLHQMRDIAYEGNVMPQKSTDFYPKVLSGLIMYSLEN